jgi:cell division protein ZapA (FtsZ GTPase activity inhibitor)
VGEVSGEHVSVQLDEETLANLRTIAEELEDLGKELCLQLTDLNKSLRLIAILQVATILTLVLMYLVHLLK